MKKGIDVSYAQGKIDWSKVKTDFVIMRGGYGRYNLDAQFENNYNGCKKNKIPCGVYHYSYADTTEKAKQEADFVISYLKGKQFEYPIAYDVEDATQSKLSRQEITDIIRVFCERVQAAGYYVAIYSFKNWLENKFYMSQLPFDVFVAQYNSTCTYKGKYGIWQYSSKTKVNGIKGNVDGDYAYKDYPSIIKKDGLNGFKKSNISAKPNNSITTKKKSVLEIAKEVRKGLWGDKTTKPTRKQRLEAAGYNYDEVQRIVTQLEYEEKAKSKAEKYKKGQLIKLSNTPVYASATAKKASFTRTGLFYIYDGEKVNGRYRITISKNLCGKKPESRNVTGWIKGE